MDPEMATRAAAHHLHDLYNEFGDWYLAIAAYNCGPGAVEKAVERTGYADFWELRNRGALPAETTNYVPIILAMTIMEKNAAEYGLEGVQMDAPLEYDTVEDRRADQPGVGLRHHRTAGGANWLRLNPAALKGMVPDGYALHVPKGMGEDVAQALAKVPAERRAAWRIHRAGPDETLASDRETLWREPGKHCGGEQAGVRCARGGRPSLDPRCGSHRSWLRPVPSRSAPARPAGNRTAAAKRPVSHRAHSAAHDVTGKSTVKAATWQDDGARRFRESKAP